MPGRNFMSSEAAALTEVRLQFARDFPVFDLPAFRRVLRKHRLNAPPAGLLLERLPHGRQGQDIARTGDHPLFSPGYYVASHPDIAAAGVPAWLHYQVFGRSEGRSPHPFIDVAWLREAIPDAAPGEELDAYLTDKSTWFAETSPYTESTRFALSGAWSRTEAPTAEIVRLHANGPWVHHNLMLIDLAGEPARARLAAFSSVLGAAPAGLSTPSLAVWSDAVTEPASEQVGPYVVIPGFFAGSGANSIWSNRDVAVSPDRTAVATAHEVVTVAAGPLVTGSTLVLYTAHAGFAELRTAVRDAAPATVFAPNSRAGEASLRLLSVEHGRPDLEVLAYGQQATVHAERIELRQPERAPVPPPAPTELTAGAADTVIVLPVEQRQRATADPRVRSALAGGAALCLIDGHGLDSWLSIIQNRNRVVVARGMAEAVGAFVDQSRIAALDGPDR